MAQHSDEAAAGYKAFDVKMIDDFMKTLKKEEPAPGVLQLFDWLLKPHKKQSLIFFFTLSN